MIVLGADTHKRSHTLAAVNAATGQLLGDKTIQVGARGFAMLLGGRAVSAASGCGRWRTAGTSRARRAVLDRPRRARRARLDAADGRPRRSSRDRGKSDQIDAVAVARAALAAGIATLPTAGWPVPSSTSGSWSITASDWSASASRSTARCRGTCTTSGPSSTLPGGALFSKSGRRTSPAGWPAPSRRCASGSLATSCAACANSPPRSTR